jgi:hypothetical protein
MVSPQWDHAQNGVIPLAKLAEIRRLFALVEEKGAQPIHLPFFSHLRARDAFPWRGPKTIPSPLPEGMKLCHVVCGQGSGLHRGSGL